MRMPAMLLLAGVFMLQACAGPRTSVTNSRDYYLLLPDTAYQVERIPLFTPDRFSTIDKNYIVLWGNRSRPYLVRLKQPCADARHVQGVALTTTGSSFYAKFDRIVVDGDQCLVESVWAITQEDVDALREQAKSRYR